MSEHRGRAVLVNFWATWCVPCVKEIPSFSKIHAETGGDVAFVGLGIDSPDNIARFNERIRPSYPLLAAGAGGTDLVRAFGDESGALPFTVLIGPDGRVVASHLGQVDESTLRRWIGPFLGRSEPVRPPPSS
jgi:thiol-disulfide isomerase/thioredoxin